MDTIKVQVSGGQGMVPYTYKTVVLKSNIVNGKNILTQAMMSNTDTKYVIKYDFVISDEINIGNVDVLNTNISQCVNPAYAGALAAYNEAHDAWIDADNAYTNDPNETTLAAKNAAYNAYTAAQTTLNNIPQYYYYAAKVINLKKGQHIDILDGCVLLNSSLNGVTSFVVASNDTTVYIGSTIPGTYEYTVQYAIQMPARCLIEFDGGSISDGTMICNNTILVFDQKEEIVLKNVELLGDFEYSADDNGAINKKDNVNGMAIITLKKNKSFASQFTQTNTIYRIIYDFDLGGGSVTIPENCILQFDGGSLNNGTVVGNNTGIEAGLTKIFDTDVTISGTWNVAEAYPEWFGAQPDILKYDNSNSINACINNTPFRNVVLQGGKSYYIQDTIYLKPKDFSFGTYFSDVNWYTTHTNNAASAIIRCIGSINAIIIPGEAQSLSLHGITVYQRWGYAFTGAGITVTGSSVRNCSFDSVKCTYFDVGFKCLFDDNYKGFAWNRFTYCQFNGNQVGMLLAYRNLTNGSHKWWMNLNLFERCDFSSNAFIGLQVVGVGSFEQNLFINCGFENNGANLDQQDWPSSTTNRQVCGVYISAMNGLGVSTFDNCYFENNIKKGYRNNTEDIADVNYNQETNISEADIISSGVRYVVRNCAFNLGMSPIVCFDNYRFSIVIDNCDFKAVESDNYSYKGNNLIILKNMAILTIAKDCYIDIRQSFLPSYYESEIIKFINTTGFNHIICNVSTPNIYGRKGDALDFTIRKKTFIMPNDEYINIQTVDTIGSTPPNLTSLTNQKPIGFRFYNTARSIPIYWNGSQNKFLDSLGQTVTTRVSTFNDKPLEVTANDVGYRVFTTDLKKPIYFDGTSWYESDGAKAGVKRSGTFAQKPANTDIYVGFAYFCTDKQTTEGTTNGIVIYHKGNDVWVDALGRVVS